LLLLRVGDFLIDEANVRLSRDGRTVELEPKAFAVLCELARRPGQLVPKEALHDAVWGHRHISSSVLKTLVSQLRGALGDDARQPHCIETVSRRGYRFVAEVDGAPVATTSTSPSAPLPTRPAAPSMAHTAPHHADGSDAPPALVARDASLAVLNDCLAHARRGKRQVVLVAGEAGIGKTTLIDRFIAGLAPQQTAHAVGQCVEEYGQGEPYMPLLEALNMLCRADGGAALVGLMRRVAPTWLVQLPWYLTDADRSSLQREVAGATPDRMLREFGELLDRCSAERPLLLVLEDLHWSDHASLRLLGHLARRRGSATWMLLGNYRPSAIGAGEHPLASLRQELLLHGLCRELDLAMFSQSEVGALVAARLGGEPAPDAFVRALHAHTDGLPLYIVNVLDALIAEGRLHRQDGRWRFPTAAQFAVPSSIVGVIEKQIARLPAPLQHALSVASVAGAEFVHTPLADALQLAPDDLQQLLADAAAHGPWLRSCGVASLPDGRLAARYAFAHALYHHAFYRRLGAAQQAHWHRRIAAALAAAHGAHTGEVAAELALHHERGGEPEPAMRRWMQVATRALGRSAAREALASVRHALQLFEQWPQAAAHPHIELELRVLEGVTLTRLHVIAEPEVAGAFERARALCDQVSDSPARARALHGLWWVRFARGELVPARALARRILELAPQGAGDGGVADGAGSAAAGLHLAGSSALGMTLAMMGELHDARRHLQNALETYAALGNRPTPGLSVQDPGVEAGGYLALVSWWMGEPGRARRLADEAVALSNRIRHPISQLIALILTAALHYLAGEMQQVLRHTEQIFDLIRTHGLPDRPGSFAWLHGHAVVVGGAADTGLAEMRAAERCCRELGMHIGLTGFHLQHAEACRHAGRPDDAMASIDQGLALAQAGREQCHLSSMHRVKAALLRERGELESARGHLRIALEVAAAQGSRYQELAALVEAQRWPAFEAPARTGRMRELLADYRDEATPVVREARRLTET
jgi:DNA-binding winged helix-turn-helix (wHTH) protein/tetratricopeptide (TPR) repeat protein